MTFKERMNKNIQTVCNIVIEVIKQSKQQLNVAFNDDSYVYILRSKSIVNLLFANISINKIPF